MSDFQKLLDLENSDFWKIDTGIKQTLIKINENYNYQTLYSKKFKPSTDSWDTNRESYLEIASTVDTCSQLFDILSQTKNCSYCNKTSVEIIELEPRDNANYNPNSTLNIGCIKDPDYFRIKHFKISIESPDTNCHKRFWECIATNFGIQSN